MKGGRATTTDERRLRTGSLKKRGSDAGSGDERRLRTGSLKKRVLFSVLALLLVVLVGLGLVVNLVLGDRLRSDLRSRLTDRAGLAQVLAAENLDAQSLADRLTGQGITASYAANGQVVVGRDQPPPDPARGGPRGPRPPAPTAAVTIVERGELLQFSLPVQQGTLTLTANLVDLDRTLATLRRIELAAGAGTLLLTGVLLTAVVGLALAPLSRMTSVARRTRDGARGRRLRPRSPKTDLGRTAAAFDDMLDALELAETEAVAAEERMRQFLADASHDLRTPIAGVITTAERVLRDDPPRAVREQRLVALVREAQRAGRLVDDLLLMARLEGGSPVADARSIDLAAVADTAVARLAEQCPDRTVTCTGAPALVSGDRDSLDRIIENLLDNARRATVPGGRIDVRVSPSGLVVADDGPGIPAADHDRVFDRFVRLDTSRQRRPGESAGSGLGLPIARGLARALGGDLTLLTQADHGDDLPGAHFQLALTPAPDRMVRPESAQDRQINAVSGRTMQL